MGSWLGRAVCCVLILAVTGCAGSWSCSRLRPRLRPPPTAASPIYQRIANAFRAGSRFRNAEQAVVVFWRVIDRLLPTPNPISPSSPPLPAASAATRWARNINQYRYDGVRAQGRVEVLDPLARQTTENASTLVKTCIDSSRVHLVDKEGESAGSPDGPRRVSYDYTVEKDQQKWYVVDEKVTRRVEARASLVLVLMLVGWALVAGEDVRAPSRSDALGVRSGIHRPPPACLRSLGRLKEAERPIHPQPARTQVGRESAEEVCVVVFRQGGSLRA